MFLIDMLHHKTRLPTSKNALPGRDAPIWEPGNHFVNGNSMVAPFPAGMQKAVFGMGCFWGMEKKFWNLEGVYVTAAGYSAGLTPNPTYKEVCTGLTGHNEVVLVVYDPAIIPFETLLKTFWEGHDPTQGMKQGNDIGTQYRSGIYVYSGKDKEAAQASLALYQQALTDAGKTTRITTEILEAGEFYYAEEYHQQYLAKNPEGYCGLGGTGVSCPIGTGIEAG